MTLLLTCLIVTGPYEHVSQNLTKAKAATATICGRYTGECDKTS